VIGLRSFGLRPGAWQQEIFQLGAKNRQPSGQFTPLGCGGIVAIVSVVVFARVMMRLQ
jgi:hypothetical protein